MEVNWVQIASAVGFGALIAKIIDIVWLQRAIHKAEKKKWLREQRLRVYAKLAEEVLSMGKSMNSREDAFSGYALAAEAVLLADNEKLANDIEHFFTMLSNIFEEGAKADNDPTKKPDDHLEGAYMVVVEESRRLIKELRRSLHE